MLSIIKVYKPETASQSLLLKTLLRVVHRVVCLQKDHF